MVESRFHVAWNGPKLKSNTHSELLAVPLSARITGKHVSCGANVLFSHKKFFETRAHVSQVGLNSGRLPSPEYWDYRAVSPWPVYIVLA